MKKNIIMALAFVALLPGCWGRKEANYTSLLKKDGKNLNNNVFTDVSIPVVGDNAKSFFDEDISEFSLVQDIEVPAGDLTVGALNYHIGAVDEKAAEKGAGAWIETDEQKINSFDVVYFDYDSVRISKKQKKHVAKNARLAKKVIEQGRRKGHNPTLVVEGHSCHSAGTAAYNLALSERRAKVLADQIASAGVPRDAIKIVGRGQEIPAVIAGKVVDGDRTAQWPNRRDEIRVIYS